MRKINKIILHCTDSPDTLDIGFKEINEWHKENGWLSKSGVSCGYHYIIRRDGTVERGRPEKDVGSHCYGHNKTSIGVVWVGKDRLSMRQDIALRNLLRHLINKHKLDPSDIYGHKEFNDHKSCPNVDMNGVRWEVLTNFVEMDESEIH